ncbi:cell division protein ZapA [Pseudofulvibacter geojedonensis]|uniref:Cell division protein ZapA n=1 Tax=Pseudofulvibacter geojedonensis TaxID=1123758 RepID=A0ABW3HY87_9FLAO
MSDKLKVKVSIADRVYPLTINPEQEEGLRKATKKIEELIKQFENSYAVRDKQDVLAMCALQFASKLEQESLDAQQDDNTINNKLLAMQDLVDKYIT